VLDAVASAAGWQRRVGPSGRGRGVALARYAGNKAYVAVIAEVEVDLPESRIDVTRLVMAADVGAIVDPEGVRQQLEGGAVHGLSRTLHEELLADARGVGSRSWSTYQVTGFGRVPPMESVLLDRPGCPPLGVGEASTPVVPAAVANAIDDAVGLRFRRLPLTRERVETHLLHLDETALARAQRLEADREGRTSKA
jgi:nicotinate dehydrogenase subunit B